MGGHAGEQGIIDDDAIGLVKLQGHQAIAPGTGNQDIGLGGVLADGFQRGGRAHTA